MATTFDIDASRNELPAAHAIGALLAKHCAEIHK